MRSSSPRHLPSCWISTGAMISQSDDRLDYDEAMLKSNREEDLVPGHPWVELARLAASRWDMLVPHWYNGLGGGQDGVVITSGSQIVPICCKRLASAGWEGRK